MRIAAKHKCFFQSFNRTIKMYNLMRCMHAGISATGCDDGHGGLAYVQNRALDRFLNRGLIGLPLPARIAGAVILQRQFEGRHGRSEPRGVRIIEPIA